ncbi:MAG: class I SAM-dependent methyltransferase [Planctomycetota bacterium]|nr:class I SAM-dependent methyltransferase [Planctomycetota bacterium]
MSDWLPMEEAQSQLQIKAILALLSDSPKEIIDVGCGDGRLLLPIAVAGHRVTGIDIDTDAVSVCARKLAEADLDATLIDGDVLDVISDCEQADAILICGQTLMLFADMDEAIELLFRCKERLSENGLVVIDDLPNDLWGELTQGRWMEGINEEGTMQLVWAKDDACFAIREGDAVQHDEWVLTDQDQPLRLWTMGSLRLIAKCAGLSAPEVQTEGAVLVMRSA